MPPNRHGLHQYYFWVIALDKETNVETGLSLGDLLSAIKPNVIAMNRLVGQYQRD